MKRYSALICLILTVLALSACSGEDGYKLIESEDNYKVFQNDSFNFYYQILDNKGKVLYEEKVEKGPLSVDYVDDDVIEIKVGKGTGVSIRKYYSLKRDMLSEEYTYVFAIAGEMAAYVYAPNENAMTDRKIAVCNVFDRNLYYKEFKLDFAQTDTPIIEGKFSSDESKLEVEYYKEDFSVTTEILEIY